MKRLQTQEFMLLSIGLIDIYQELGELRKMLQRVEQFPWDIPKAQESLVKSLKMRANIKLADEDGNFPQHELDEKLWPFLKTNMKSVIECDYKGLKTIIFNAVRRGRSSDDRNSTALNGRISVQNKLSSFSRVLASKYHGRIKDISTHTTYTLIQLMSQCLDMDEIIEKGTDDKNFNIHGKMIIKKICEIAQYTPVEMDQIVLEYQKFKALFKNLHTNENHYTKLFEFLLYKHHECKDQRCNDNCRFKDQLEIPKKPIPMKFLH